MSQPGASDIRLRQSTVAEHLSGTSDSWHGKISTEPLSLFPPSRERYHLYIGLFCPFAHRANIVRHLKGLQSYLPLSVVRPYPKGDENGWPGWKFPEDENEYHGSTVDPLYGSEYLHQIYFKADLEYKGRYSVPVLWDTKTETIVNNESTELLRNLTHAFDEILLEDGKEVEASMEFYPDHLATRIDEICKWMQADLNAGVYKAGFAPDQATYDKNVIPVFAALNKLEKIIKDNGGPFALGKELTEVDIRLYPTLIRFDTVYIQHFKCNLGTVRANYPVLNNYMKGLYWGKASLIMRDGTQRTVWGFGPETTDFKHIKENYTKSHFDINPKAITPRGPWPDIEDGYESDWGNVKVGGIAMLEVVEAEQKLP